MTGDALFDAGAFSLEVRLAMARANLSLRQLQTQIGVDQASIHRVAKKQLPPSVETYLRLRRWLDQGGSA
jgi:predicted transcriptional regulator